MHCIVQSCSTLMRICVSIYVGSLNPACFIKRTLDEFFGVIVFSYHIRYWDLLQKLLAVQDINE